MSAVSIPPIVFTLWQVTAIVAAILLVPAAVYGLHTLYRSASSIRRYTRDSLAAARAIESNISALPALNGTIEVASEMLRAAEGVATKLDTMASVLERRS